MAYSQLPESFLNRYEDGVYRRLSLAASQAANYGALDQLNCILLHCIVLVVELSMTLVSAISLDLLYV